MTVFLIILSVVLWALSLISLAGRPALGPALSYLAMLAVSFAETGGMPLLPVNNTMLIGWLCMALVVMVATYLQPAAVISQTRGMGYMVTGAVTGLAVGLLAFTFAFDISLLYALMVIGIVAGTFLGLLLYTRTPDGRPVAIGSGNFFRYLLAKGFPTVITLAQFGVVLVLAIAIYS